MTKQEEKAPEDTDVSDNQQPEDTEQEVSDANELQTEIEELTDSLKRVQADFVNYRKRSDKERMEAVKIGKRQAIQSLLPLIDNLERALTHVPGDLQDHSWAQGVRQVGKQVENTLNEMGVQRIEANGKPFDPNLHEAVSFEDGEGEEIVDEVMQIGYRTDDEIIRPAMVKVTRNKQNTNKSKGEK